MKVYHYPSSSSNPYIALLYGAMERQGVTIERRPFYADIVHIHWEHNLYGSRFCVVALMKFLKNTLWLLALRLWGVRIIWTMHNFADHGGRYPRFDRLMRSIVGRLAHGIIVQQHSLAAELQRHNKKIHFIPLGNYIGVHGPRREHKVNVGPVLLALGALRPYKKLEHIIHAVRAVKNPLLRLVIAGQGNPEYIAKLRVLGAGDARISIEGGYIPDTDVADLLSIADYVIFWHDDSVLTSSAIMLALSYGVPVIARTSYAADVVVHGMNGYLFDTADGLILLLKKLQNLPPLNPDRVIDSVRHNTWESVATQTIAVFSSLTHAK